MTADRIRCQEQDSGTHLTPKARLFDSYNGANSEDIMARLDYVAIELREKPSLHLHLFVYGPKVGTGERFLKMSAEYLVNTRGIEDDRIVSVYGGRYKDFTEVLTELWLVPPDAELPKVRDYRTDLKQIRGKVAEYTRYDGLPECGGPCASDITIAGVADALQEQPESVAYIVASNKEGANIGAWRRVAKAEAASLESLGISSDRIRIVFAGTAKVDDDDYSEQARIQLWILAKDAPPPGREAKSEHQPKAATRIGTFSSSDLKYPAIEKLAFEGFADVLKADQKLGICIIYRPEEAANFRDPEYPRFPDEPKEVDLPKLIEKWKTQLARDYKIESGRIFIITAAAKEGNDGTIETWIIPPGAAMPDPYADDSIDSDPPVVELMEF